MNQAIQDFIDGKRVAVVGASRSGKKFGNTVCAELAQRVAGHGIVPAAGLHGLQDVAA